jgi:hypothetical protein
MHLFKVYDFEAKVNLKAVRHLRTKEAVLRLLIKKTVMRTGAGDCGKELQEI